MDEILKFTTIKWIEIFDQPNGTYNKNKDIRFKKDQYPPVSILFTF